MKTDWAADQLQTIRTLMERSALYRRALAPVTTLAGALGLAGGVAGWLLGITKPELFVAFWVGVAAVAGVLGLLLIRRQAFKAAEPFWSLPTRRVAQAVALPLLSAGVLSVMFCTSHPEPENTFAIIILWQLFYGFALNAAGFFMRRGIRLFGWVMALSGLGLGVYLMVTGPPDFGPRIHWLMGGTFGGFHLAYGIYLYFTEKSSDAS
jgi:hypothetical protein